MTMFRIKLLRATIIDGRRFLAGAELHVEAGAAARMIFAGAARLADEEDLARLIRANKVNGAAWTSPATR